MINYIEFEGACSGDGGSFCWNVDKKTYIKLCGWDDELSPFDCADLEIKNMKPIMKSDLFRVYPNDIFGFSDKKRKFKIRSEDID